MIAKAIKENNEAMQASEALQYAVAQRAEAGAGFEYQIRAFRQVVRDELGSNSK